MPARVLIVDDHAVVRLGIRMVLTSDCLVEVCGEACDGLDALRKVLELHPDLVILDVTMPQMNGFEAATQMRLIEPSVKIIFYSIHEIPATARFSGGDAFVSKSSSRQELTATVDRVLHG